MTALHVMLDLETLATTPDATIVAVGAVSFLDTEVVGNFYGVPDLEQGRAICPKTVNWWMTQNRKARSVFNHKKKNSLATILSDFTSWVSCCVASRKADKWYLWGNGADFDNVILKHAIEQYGMSLLDTKVGWHYSHNRCYRTIKSLCPEVAPPSNQNKHNALADAMAQTEHLLAIWAAFPHLAVK